MLGKSGSFGRKAMLAAGFALAATSTAMATEWGNGDATLVVGGDCVSQNVGTATWVSNCDYRHRTICDYILQVNNTKSYPLPITITLTQLLPNWVLRLPSLSASFTLPPYKTQQFPLFRTSIDHPSQPLRVTLNCRPR
ncbi:MAG TPA: hypothetical protein VG651_19960 [Stellaceae bacterium]|nr:hypothetical protein [Stellaceae bacterium]